MKGIVLLLALCGSLLSVQDAVRYQLLPDQSDDLDQAIRQATARLNFLLRPIARSRLRQTNARYQYIELLERADTIAISYEGRPPIRAPADGSKVDWQREDGEHFQVWMKREHDVLYHHFKADDGERLNEFRWSANGDTLWLAVTLNSPRLPQPVRYRLVYKRG